MSGKQSRAEEELLADCQVWRRPYCWCSKRDRRLECDCKEDEDVGEEWRRMMMIDKAMEQIGEGK